MKTLIDKSIDLGKEANLLLRKVKCHNRYSVNTLNDQLDKFIKKAKRYEKAGVRITLNVVKVINLGRVD